MSATYADGYRAGTVSFFYGEQATEKAKAFGESSVLRARKKLRAVNAPDYSEVLIETVGDEAEYGEYAQQTTSRSVAVKVAVKHEDVKAAGLLLKELTGHGLAAPPGLSGFAGGRAKPTPVLKLFSFTIPKEQVEISIDLGDGPVDFEDAVGAAFEISNLKRASGPDAPGSGDGTIPLIKLAWARSGDKGDKANIGVLPRKKEYTPYIWAALTEQEVQNRFEHFLKGKVSRYYLPGTGAINFVLDKVLGGGGVASLRNDPQGKGYSQILLQTPIPVPASLLDALS